MKNKLKIFEEKKLRSVWSDEKQKWFFSVIDIVAILTNQDDYSASRNYWKVLKHRLNQEESELVTNCNQLKMIASDGKMRETDVADTETIFRLIQSIPSPKAEPIKMWLAKVGNERVNELADPEQSINLARQNWQKLGRSEKWIAQRMTSQETRNKLTNYWKNADVKEGDEFAILTNIIHQEWTGLNISQHKKLKNLKSQNLRDHMNEAELIFTALAELSTRQIAETLRAKGFEENKIPAKKGGKIASDAKLALEQKTGKKIVDGSNFISPTKLNKKLK
jgi:hypothetical protein